MSSPDTSNARNFQSHPQTAISQESPLALSYQQPGQPVLTDNNGVVIKEHAFLGHIVLRGDAGALNQALREVLDISLPHKPLTLINDETREMSVQWISPDEWLLIVAGGKEFDTENRLRAALGDQHFSITNVSGGQTLLQLSGSGVVNVLMKSVVCDVHPAHFPPGKGVTTVFAKTIINLRRPTEEIWQLVIRRSFADYIYRWLLDAADEHNVGVMSAN